MDFLSGLAWSVGTVVVLVAFSGSFRGLAEIERRPFFDWRNFSLGIELCVASLVECISTVRSLATCASSDRLQASVWVTAFCLGLGSIFLLLIVTVLHYRNGRSRRATDPPSDPPEEDEKVDAVDTVAEMATAVSLRGTIKMKWKSERFRLFKVGNSIGCTWLFVTVVLGHELTQR